MQIARESIFISSLRAFFRCFFSIFGIVLGLIAASICYGMLAGVKTYEEKTTLTILPDLEGKRVLVPTTAPAVLQIFISGVIGEKLDVRAKDIEEILLSSRSGLLSHDRVKAVMLHINTPGGSAIDSDTIYQLLKTYKEKYHVPVFAFVNGLCASGGMYIASSADQIFATSPSVIGSVGVVMGPFFNLSETIAKIGMTSKTLTAGLDKDMMNPFRTWKPDEDASLRAVMDSLYNRFVQIVADSRKRLDKDKLVHEYGAQIFDPIKAQELGYIDVADATYAQALTALLEAAQIDPSKPYQVVELKPYQNWMEALVEAKSPLLTGKIEHQVGLAGQRASLQEPFAYLYEPGLAF